MSRETDSPSSGPNGPGGAAYPSGAQPYGSGQYPSTTVPPGPGTATIPEESSVTAPPAKPSTPDSDGPKTETQLTTRIRINIPGSRPIPPVVVRQSMPESEAGYEPEPAPAPAPAPEQGPGDEAASNWFAPRKAGSGPDPGPGPAPAGGQRFDTPPQGYPQPQAGPRPGAPTRPGPGGPRSGPMPAPAPAGGQRFDTPPQGYPQPQAGPRPGAPMGPGPGGPGVGTGPGAGPGPGYPAPPAGPGGPRPGGPAGPGQGHMQGPGQGHMQGPGQGHMQGPGGGPAGPPGPPPVAGAAYGPGSGPVAQALGAPVPPAPAWPGTGRGPAGPTGGPELGSVPLGGPQAPSWPGPELDSAGHPQPAPGARAAGQGAAAPAPANKGKAPARPAKKSRNKLVLLGGALFTLLGVAYGAGLLLNHSDVPKGTTVMGVDISGTRDEAVAKLQTAFGNRASAPLQLTVGGKPVELKPEKAGLSLDGQTTVRNAAGSDYNPVTVIGSLFGSERQAEAVMPIDEEKLRVALQEVAGTAGAPTEATITFDTGKAVAVPGKPGSMLDVDSSVGPVTKAFRDMVASGRSTPVDLPVATKDPVVGKDELDRAMKEFAEPAMSAPVLIKAGAKSIPFGAKSLPKILSMQVVEGHLVEKYDLEALKTTYGNTFDGVLIMRGTGKKTAITPQDVAGALGKALRGKTTAERTEVIDTNPN
ncbi:hypothetical protein OTB20_16405 [Streptomyces sp. H27-H1]|uniref:peptidoglycan binding domain-containing protein n=1 Tax=Streptomyces sp. H27-H1 TaxID=2996461 RepID=UPI00226FB30B|nr:hypothetical protein [Streptomyces sp. H27-H1]